MIHKLTHGSPKKITPDEGFKLFDYMKGSDDNSVTSNGADSYGPGIYTFTDDPGFKKAACYAEKKYAYGLRVDADETMDTMEPDTIPEEAWLLIINEMSAHYQKMGNYDEEEFASLVYDVSSAYEDDDECHLSKLEALQDHLEALKDEPVNYSDYDISDYDPADASSWVDDIMEGYRTLADTSEKMWDEIYGRNKTVEEYVRRCLYSEPDLWSVICRFHENIAVEIHGDKVLTMNRTFSDLVLKHGSEYADLTVAIVNNGDFAVVFDPRAIEVTKTIDFSREREASLEM